MDLRFDNPVGRVPDATRMSTSSLTVRSDGWRLARSGGTWNGSIERSLSALDEVHQLVISGADMGLGEAGQRDLASYLHRAAARGTALVGPLSEPLAARLPATLASLIPPLPPAAQAGDLVWDIAAVRQRRAAIRAGFNAAPDVSAVLVSRRPHLVSATVEQLARQTYSDLEIVVGLHGVPVPADLAEAAGNRQLTVIEIDGDVVFGQALNQAFGAAAGAIVTKIDDDDFYGPEHVWDLVLAHRYSGATVVGKTTTVVYLEALDTTVRRVFGTRESFTHRVAGGTMMISRKALADLGGWSQVPRAVDTALIASVTQNGGTLYQPHDIGYLYTRHADRSIHTWDAGLDHFLRNTREQWVGLLEHEEFGTVSP